jgi:regulator of protease activity HflC (stomatin/prohibitin superfamily)
MRRLALCLVIAFLVSFPAAAQETQTPSNVIVVQPNEIGVLFNTQTGHLGEPLTAGTHVIDLAIEQVTVYSTAQQAYTLAGDSIDPAVSSNAVSARTLDGQQVDVEVSILFSINPENINSLHTRWGNRYAEDFLAPSAHSVIRQIVASFTVQQLTTGSGSDLEAQITAGLRPRLEPEGLVLSNAFVRNLVFSQAVTESIEAQLAINNLWYRAQIESEIATMRAQTEAERLRLIGVQLANNPLLIFVIDGIHLADSAFSD